MKHTNLFYKVDIAETVGFCSAGHKWYFLHSRNMGPCLLVVNYGRILCKEKNCGRLPDSCLTTTLKEQNSAGHMRPPLAHQKVC